jgi:2-C-methyl-D-erythritol 4-phosphate cytidylyltransferase
VVAAGRGHRFGGLKQFEDLAGRPLHAWSVSAARHVADGVVLVVPDEMAGDEALVAAADRVVAGGASRSDSVRAGLAEVPADAGVVLVHDAARPLASPSLFRAVVEAVVAGADGAVPGIPIVDTVKQVEHGAVRVTLDRAGLVRVQTPQGFRAEWLRRAHSAGADATDDAALVEAIGGRVVVVEGEEDNLKITSPEDLSAVEARCAPHTRRRRGVGAPAL